LKRIEVSSVSLSLVINTVLYRHYSGFHSRCIKSVLENATERSVVGPIGTLQIVHDNFFDSYKRIVDKHRKGEGKGARWITSLYDVSNMGLVKLFLEAGVQVRHIRNLPPLTFAVDDRYFYSTISAPPE